MILRHRRPARDDNQILRLIAAELVPLSQVAHPDLKFDRKLTKKRLAQGTTVVAAGKNGAIKGFITYYIKNRALCVDMLAVQRQARRNGLGTSLLRHAEQVGRKHRCDSAILYVDAGNEAGKAFYRRLGYHELQYLPHSKCYLYVKPLLAAPVYFPLNRPPARFPEWLANA
ncbi:MAG TPA: GNAT family N-acetyltransferase [Bacilli bacterium]